MNDKTVAFTPVETGDMSEIPPDAPAGGWDAFCTVKKKATAKDNFPMLVLEWRLEAAHEDANESHVGAKVTDFVTFFPLNHPAVRMARTRLKALCDALKIDPPAVTRLETWDDISEFIDALEGAKAQIWTILEVQRDTGETRTAVRYAPPPGANVVPIRGMKPAAFTESAPAKKMMKKKKASPPA